MFNIVFNREQDVVTLTTREIGNKRYKVLTFDKFALSDFKKDAENFAKQSVLTLFTV